MLHIRTFLADGLVIFLIVPNIGEIDLKQPDYNSRNKYPP